ncbi:MAG: DUF485 domain-containing protein [Candidatus Sericytochromatia bacterium]
MQSTSEMLNSAEFKALVSQRWWVSGLLLLGLFGNYYGFLLLIAYQKPIMTLQIWGKTPLGIPLGAAVIVFSWLLTAVYVVWANRAYDPVVHRLAQGLKAENP